jgi:hypothetical protein
MLFYSIDPSPNFDAELSTLLKPLGSRARLPDGTHIFKPKIPIWVNFGGP